jgi:hypothetical protein
MMSVLRNPWRLSVKLGDLVKVKNTLPGDGLEMRKLYHEHTLCLLIDFRLNDFWSHVLDGGVQRSIPTNRLEIVNESR